MDDEITEVIERLDTLRTNITNFRITNNPDLLEDALDELEEIHDDLEEILEDLD